MSRLVVLAAALSLWVSPGHAQDAPPSTCQAIASAIPKATFVALKAEPPTRLAVAGAGTGDVAITFVHHSTYLIRSPHGVTIATDYSGFSGEVVPRVATMNKAHATHYTDHPDPAIQYVLRGWDPAGGAAHHNLAVDDVLVRNVPSDIRRWSGGVERDGNSIFVFETAGLCIGHLGHLHFELTGAQFAAIGRLDVVMVPVDGGYTMSQGSMAAMVERLQSRVVLPMHNFRGRMDEFLKDLPGFAVERRVGPTLALSARSLPNRPTVILLDGV